MGDGGDHGEINTHFSRLVPIRTIKTSIYLPISIIFRAHIKFILNHSFTNDM
jgi:hypothetical protein